MDGINITCLAGNLCADADHRETQHGRHVARFRVAVSQSYTNDKGERKSSTQYVPVVWWGSRPKATTSMLVKGARVIVVGRLETSVEQKGDERRHRMEVVANDVTFERIPGKTTGAPAEPPVAGDDDFGVDA